ncbi:hypothetical protein [Eilatimonas milleporae]|uniref:Asparagine synthase n=1 Tax=Eilatimonas milleporae TaxID=911205 RepID=A0A3M0CR78_9PROT|nr:hypothetical protein [Eilatimonas milleporae]RMB12064.1 hypothetical protein BXY39_0554 [Eilatimonas milleporae]
MEFLIARASAKTDLACLKNGFDWHRLTTIDGGHHIGCLNNYMFIVPENSVDGTSEAVIFDGHGVIGGQAVSASDGAKPRPGVRAVLSDYAAAAKRGGAPHVPASGVFCICHIDFETGRFDLTLDPLSQYNVFVFETRDLRVFGNNIFMIEAVLTALGQRPRRLFRGAAFEAALGMGAVDTTGLEDVALFPSDMMLTGDSRRDELEFLPLNRLAHGSADRDGQLARAAGALSRSLRAVHACYPDHDIVYDLTGGLDSRMVLAASRHAGLRNQLFFRSEGGQRDDIVIPDRLADRFGMRFAPFPQNFNGERIDRRTLARRAVFRQQGQSTIYQFDLGRCRVTDVVRVRGGFGEIARLSYRLRSLRSAVVKWHTLLKGIREKDRIVLDNWRRVFTRDIFGALTDGRALAFFVMRRMLGHRKLFTDDFRQAAYMRITDHLLSLAGGGMPAHFLVNALYLTDRARRHFAYTSQMLNLVRPTFEPLADIELWRLACLYSNEDRHDEKAFHDLFSALDPDVLSIPFSRSSLAVHDGYFKVLTDAEAGGKPPERVSMKSVPDPILTDGPEERLAGLKGHALDIVALEDYFFDLLFSCGQDSDVWRYLNRAEFERLNQDPERTKRIADNGLTFLRLLYGLIWIHRQDIPVPISEIV